jgi:hypothetical protein
MAIYRLLHGHAFEPHEIAIMTCAYEDILRALGLADRSDPITHLVAARIIECAQKGECDPGRLRDQVLHSLQK